MDIDKVLGSLDEMQESITNASRLLSGGPASYYFKKFKGYYVGCMAAAKFKVGDRVTLAKELDWSQGLSGWESSRHFLVPGEPATVKEVDYYWDEGEDVGRYVYAVMFDNESWISSLDKDKTPMPVIRKHTFSMGQSLLTEYKNDVTRIKEFMWRLYEND